MPTVREDQMVSGMTLVLDNPNHDELGRFTEGAGTHTVKLPKDQKRLNFAPASEALTQMGYTLDIKSGHTDLAKGETSYEVQHSSGHRLRIGAKAMREFIYRQQRKNIRLSDGDVVLRVGNTRRSKYIVLSGGAKLLVDGSG